MILSRDVERLRTPEQVRAYLDGNAEVDFQPVSRSEAYAFVSRFDYTRLGVLAAGSAALTRGNKGGRARRWHRK